MLTLGSKKLLLIRISIVSPSVRIAVPLPRGVGGGHCTYGMSRVARIKWNSWGIYRLFLPLHSVRMVKRWQAVVMTNSIYGTLPVVHANYQLPVIQMVFIQLPSVQIAKRWQAGALKKIFCGMLPQGHTQRRCL